MHLRPVGSEKEERGSNLILQGVLRHTVLRTTALDHSARQPWAGHLEESKKVDASEQKTLLLLYHVSIPVPGETVPF